MHDKYVKRTVNGEEKPAIEMMPSATLNIFKNGSKFMQKNEEQPSGKLYTQFVP